MRDVSKLPVDGFEWVKEIPSPNKKLKKFIKVINHYDEESLEGYIPKESAWCTQWFTIFIWKKEN